MKFFRVSDHVFGVTDDMVPVEKLEKQCSKCFPRNRVTADTSAYSEGINAVIVNLLGPKTTSSASLDVLLRRLGLSGSDDDYDVDGISGDDGYEIY